MAVAGRAGEPAGGAQLLRCSIPTAENVFPAELVRGVVSRWLPGQTAPQTLVACGGSGLRPLLGANARGPLQLGPPPQLYAGPAAGGGGAGGAAAAAAARQPHAWGRAPAYAPSWDPWSASIYMVHATRRTAILRLAADNTVTLVAGSVEEQGNADGAGGAARFSVCFSIAADGRGRLYVANGDRIRQLQLPAAWEAGCAAAAGGEVVVTTLPLRTPTQISDLAFGAGGGKGSSGTLVYATHTALYRLPLGGGEVAPAPVLLAGREGRWGTDDGRRSDARFSNICGLVVDGDGCTYVAEERDEYGQMAVRRVACDGTVVTITHVTAECGALAILPNGYLALSTQDEIHVLDLGLRLPPGHAGLPPPAPKPSGPPPNSLNADMGSLLHRQPDGTADVTVLVQEQPFHAHKTILGSRSPYFRQRFGGGFADGSAQQVELPDAQPEVFERVLLYVYTDDVDVPPALAQGVAELADRLLLPGLCTAAQAVVEAGVKPSSVVGALLWAEGAGPSFAALLGRLKGWYVEHHEEVLEQAEESVGLLAAHSPNLMVELTKASVLAAKRQRTH